MKDSGIAWIGKIPEGWDVNRNKICFDCSKTIIGKESMHSQLLSLTTKGIKEKRPEDSTGKVPDSYDTYQSVEPDDIVMCLFDLDVSAVFSGRSVYYGMTSPAYKVLKCKAQYILPAYAEFWFAYVFDGRKFKHYSKNLRYTLTYEEFATLPITLPSLSEQSRIAEFLDCRSKEIDHIMEQTRVTIEEYKKLKQSIITEAVTQGVRGPRKMKDSGVEWIGKIPEEWGVTKLKYFSTIRSGITLGKVYPNGTKLVTYPYLRVANVQGSYTDLNDVAMISVTEEEAKKYRLYNGELLMTEGGDRDKLGRGTVWHAEIDPCLHQNHVFALRTTSRLLPEFVGYLSASSVGRNYFDVTANQSVHLASTNSTTILNFAIPFVSFEEQSEIVSYLDTKCAMINRMMDAKQQLLTELEAYKKSVIYEYVTGKREVPQ